MHNTYHRLGHGPHAVIVLHGWFGDAHAFSPMETALDGAAFSYVFMDSRGYGGMRGAAGEYSMEEVARDALALADALGFATFSVVGHSMGGMALERLVLLAPLRLRKLVAVAPVPSCGVSMDAAARALFLGASGDVQARRAIIDRSTGGRLPASWLEWKAQYSWESADPAAFARYFLAWSGTDPRFDAALMRRTYLAWYPQARLEVLANAGHYPMNETPLALAASIEAFLSAQ
jgi:esterase